MSMSAGSTRAGSSTTPGSWTSRGPTPSCCPPACRCRPFPAIEAAEQALGRPVLSAATATTHEVLALLGENPFLPGAGAALAPPAS